MRSLMGTFMLTSLSVDKAAQAHLNLGWPAIALIATVVDPFLSLEVKYEPNKSIYIYTYIYVCMYIYCIYIDMSI